MTGGDVNCRGTAAPLHTIACLLPARGSEAAGRAIRTSANESAAAAVCPEKCPERGNSDLR
jgi:hypothetical protein